MATKKLEWQGLPTHGPYDKYHMYFIVSIEKYAFHSLKWTCPPLPTINVLTGLPYNLLLNFLSLLVPLLPNTSFYLFIHFLSLCMWSNIWEWQLYPHTHNKQINELFCSQWCRNNPLWIKSFLPFKTCLYSCDIPHQIIKKVFNII